MLPHTSLKIKFPTLNPRNLKSYTNFREKSCTKFEIKNPTEAIRKKVKILMFKTGLTIEPPSNLSERTDPPLTSRYYEQKSEKNEKWMLTTRLGIQLPSKLSEIADLTILSRYSIAVYLFSGGEF